MASAPARTRRAIALLARAYVSSHQRIERETRPEGNLMRLALLSRFAIGAIATLVSACSSNPNDAAQQPRVTVTQAAPGPAVIAWQPAGAQLVRVYRGSTAGDGYTESLMWSIAASTNNSLPSGVQYGVMPPGGTI